LAERATGGGQEPSPEEVQAAKQAIIEFEAATAPAAKEVGRLSAELESLNSEKGMLQANRENIKPPVGESANAQAERANKDAILQKQIIPDQLAPIIELLNKTIAAADKKLEAGGVDISGLTAKDKADALKSDPTGIGRKLQFLITAIESASGVTALKPGQIRMPQAVLPEGAKGTTPESRVKSAAKLTGMFPSEVANISGVLERVEAALKSLEAQAATGGINLEELAYSLQNVSSEARQTATNLLDTTTTDQQKAAAAGGGGAGGGGKSTGGPSGPMDDQIGRASCRERVYSRV
jgi:hypothetical protein